MTGHRSSTFSYNFRHKLLCRDHFPQQLVVYLIWGSKLTQFLGDYSDQINGFGSLTRNVARVLNTNQLLVSSTFVSIPSQGGDPISGAIFVVDEPKFSYDNARKEPFWGWHTFDGQNMQLTTCMFKHCHESTWYLQISTRWMLNINSTPVECIQPQAVRYFSNTKRTDSGGLAPGQCRPCHVYQSAFGKTWVDTLVEKVSDKAEFSHPSCTTFLALFFHFKF